MKPVSIYFREVPFNDNNKFVLDFLDEEFAQRVYFSKKTDYYMASLDCNLILKEEIEKDRIKLIEKLSEISRELIEKGTVCQVDIGYLTSSVSYIHDAPDIEHLTYNWVIQPSLFDDNCYKYKFFETVEKKLRIVKYFRHLLYLKAMVLNLKDLFCGKVKIMFQYD